MSNENTEAPASQENLYDHSEWYRANVIPLIKQAFALCKAKGVPFYVTAVVANDEKRCERYNSTANAAKFVEIAKVNPQFLTLAIAIAAKDRTAEQIAEMLIHGAMAVKATVIANEASEGDDQ